MQLQEFCTNAENLMESLILHARSGKQHNSDSRIAPVKIVNWVSKLKYSDKIHKFKLPELISN